MGQALRNLAGLEASPVPARRDAFVYKHGETGFVFQIGPADPDSDGAADDLAFMPLALGSAAQVQRLHLFLSYSLQLSDVLSGIFDIFLLKKKSY